MTVSVKIENDMRERRCLVSGEVLAEGELVRFAADPDGNVVPDVAANLPGRGMWVRADRKSVTTAATKNLFSKSAKATLKAGADLSDRVERLLVARMQGDLGLARRAGQAVLGFDNVLRALDDKVPPALLIEARDGAADGRRKLAGSVRARDLKIETMEMLTSAELGLALGRENVIHAALKPGRLAERLIFDAGRLRGFRD
ncbi:MAG TPA: RNA-binding protein, partial [Rhizomicrobium sp.]|nr:RNA-binding protein [Rhizomicrobium sp.]